MFLALIFLLLTIFLYDCECYYINHSNNINIINYKILNIHKSQNNFFNNKVSDDKSSYSFNIRNLIDKFKQFNDKLFINVKGKLIKCVKTLKSVIVVILINIILQRDVKAISGESIGGSSYSNTKVYPSRRPYDNNVDKKINSDKYNANKLKYDYNTRKSFITIQLEESSAINNAVSILILFSILSIINIDRIKTKFNFWGSSLHCIQLVFLLNKSEKKHFLDDMNSLQYIKTKNKQKLIDTIMQLCIIINRYIQSQSLFGGNFLLYKRYDSLSNRDYIESQYNKLNIIEQGKFYKSKYVVNNSQIDNKNINELSYVVLTLLLTVHGPVLSNNRIPYISNESIVIKLLKKIFKLNKNLQSPNSKDIQEFLFALPGYLNKVLKIQKNQESYAISEDRIKQAAGFNYNIIWTPNKDDEMLTEKDVIERWPNIYSITYN